MDTLMLNAQQQSTLEISRTAKRSVDQIQELYAPQRDEATLTRLESEHQILSLEQARKEEPWELISAPTC